MPSNVSDCPTLTSTGDGSLWGKICEEGVDRRKPKFQHDLGEAWRCLFEDPLTELTALSNPLADFVCVWGGGVTQQGRNGDNVKIREVRGGTGIDGSTEKERK